MSPSVCSHVVLGKRHGPRLPPSAYRIPDYAPHSSLKCWKVLDHGPHGFPRVRDRDQNAFPHVTARPNIFSPEYGALLPHSWIQEAPLKGLEGGDFGDLYRKTHYCVKWTPSVQGTGLPPPPVAEENQVYLEAAVRQIFAQQMDKLFVLAALPPWPLLLGLAISFRVYAPVAHSVPPWPLLLGFLAVLNSFQSLRCMHSFQRSVFWVSGLPSIVS